MTGRPNAGPNGLPSLPQVGGLHLLVSPAEPQSVKDSLTKHGVEWESSTRPERHGVDMLWRARDTWWGVQRKAVNDFVASLRDGRIAREVSQMRHSVSMPCLIIEGRVNFTVGDEPKLILTHGMEITHRQWQGMMWTLASQGITVHRTAVIADTSLYIKRMMDWSSKAHHTSVTARPKLVESAWGKPNNRDWAVHVLQGFDGVGPEVAGNIFDHFGRLPLRWDVDDGDELLDVKGLGPGRVKKMLEALG